MLLEPMVLGEPQTAHLVTHRMPLEEGPRGCERTSPGATNGSR